MLQTETFETVPSWVQAVQWDGSREMAQEIIAWVETKHRERSESNRVDYGIRVSVPSAHVESEDSEETIKRRQLRQPASHYLEFPLGTILEPGLVLYGVPSGQLLTGDWLVMTTYPDDTFAEFFVVSPDRFDQHYRIPAAEYRPIR